MQITPETAKDIERHSGGTTFKLGDLSDPEINIRYGTFLPARTARPLRRRRGRRARRLQRRPGQRRQVGRQRPDAGRHPVPGNARLRRRGARQAAAPTATSTPGSWGTERRGAETAPRRAGPRRRPRPRRLLGRRPGAAADLPRAGHQRRRRHLGAGLLQPGDGAGRRSRRPPGPPRRPRPRPPRSGWRSSPAPASPAASPTELSAR